MPDRDVPEDNQQRLLQFWYSAVERFGFAAVTLIAVLYVARVDLIQPLVRSHDELVKEVIRTTHEQTEMLRQQTELIREVRSMIDARSESRQ
jgi:hypothetical protein